MATPGGDDLILCQITSQAVGDRHAIPILDDDFETGSLKQPSNARPNRIFTADTHIALYTIGKLKSEKLNQIIEKTVKILKI